MPPDTTETASAREDLCRLLAACWYEPDAAFAEERLFESLRAAAQALAPSLAESARRAGEAYPASDLRQLQHEYRRLFAGREAAMDPHESRWHAGDEADGEEAAMALHGLYQAGGFEPEEDEEVRPDHLAVELEFLWVLTTKQHEAQRAGLPEVLSSWQLLRGVFLRQHLGAWVGRFAAAVAAQSPVPFYRELAALTADFVGMEAAVRPQP